MEPELRTGGGFHVLDENKKACFFFPADLEKGSPPHASHAEYASASATTVGVKEYGALLPLAPHRERVVSVYCKRVATKRLTV